MRYDCTSMCVRVWYICAVYGFENFLFLLDMTTQIVFIIFLSLPQNASYNSHTRVCIRNLIHPEDT